MPLSFLCILSTGHIFAQGSAKPIAVKVVVVVMFERRGTPAMFQRTQAGGAGTIG
jgi:hypothetical protein